MRYIGREIDKITSTDFRCKFEPLAPADLATTSDDIDSNLVTAMVMRSRPRIRPEGDRADPGFSPPGAGEIKCGSPSRSAWFTHSSL
jgi:hypothetical protein